MIGEFLLNDLNLENQNVNCDLCFVRVLSERWKIWEKYTLVHTNRTENDPSRLARNVGRGHTGIPSQTPAFDTPDFESPNLRPMLCAAGLVPKA